MVIDQLSSDWASVFELEVGENRSWIGPKPVLSRWEQADIGCFLLQLLHFRLRIGSNASHRRWYSLRLDFDSRSSVFTIRYQTQAMEFLRISRLRESPDLKTKSVLFRDVEPIAINELRSDRCALLDLSKPLSQLHRDLSRRPISVNSYRGLARHNAQLTLESSDAISTPDQGNMRTSCVGIYSEFEIICAAHQVFDTAADQTWQFVHDTNNTTRVFRVRVWEIRVFVSIRVDTDKTRKKFVFSCQTRPDPKQLFCDFLKSNRGWNSRPPAMQPDLLYPLATSGDEALSTPSQAYPSICSTRVGTRDLRRCVTDSEMQPDQRRGISDLRFVTCDADVRSHEQLSDVDRRQESMVVSCQERFQYLSQTSSDLFRDFGNPSKHGFGNTYLVVSLISRGTTTIFIFLNFSLLSFRFLIPKHLSNFFGYQHFRLCRCVLDNPDLLHLSWF
ncbi:hypothetical protein LXL04_010000 [Taraxacum kok-saghyz]